MHVAYTTSNWFINNVQIFEIFSLHVAADSLISCVIREGLCDQRSIYASTCISYKCKQWSLIDVSFSKLQGEFCRLFCLIFVCLSLRLMFPTAIHSYSCILHNNTNASLVEWRFPWRESSFNVFQEYNLCPCIDALFEEYVTRKEFLLRCHHIIHRTNDSLQLRVIFWCHMYVWSHILLFFCSVGLSVKQYNYFQHVRANAQKGRLSGEDVNMLVVGARQSMEYQDKNR